MNTLKNYIPRALYGEYSTNFDGERHIGNFKLYFKAFIEMSERTLTCWAFHQVDMKYGRSCI